MEGILATVTKQRSIILATEVKALTDGLEITTQDGKYRIPWEECSPKLSTATDLERSHFEKSPSGYGIHWPLLDEDLSVGGLVLGRKTVGGQ